MLKISASPATADTFRDDDADTDEDGYDVSYDDSDTDAEEQDLLH